METTLIFLSVQLSIYANSFFCSAAEAPDAVLDIAGKKLRAGATYYILPDTQGGGGGVIVEGSKPCPHDVAQDPTGERGIPLVFSPVNPKKGVTRPSTDLNIKFRQAFPICPPSNEWDPDVRRIGTYDRETGQYFVTTGGVEGNPGRQTLNNWFKIEKFRHGYKLVFCPSVCSDCKAMCKDIGIFVQYGRRRLALSDVPFKFMFKEA